jgi:hypothetical protein
MLTGMIARSRTSRHVYRGGRQSAASLVWNGSTEESYIG